MPKANNSKQVDGSNLNFEAQLWAAADKMRGHMDASEYKHVCLGLVFLKYISDAFEEKREELLMHEFGNLAGAWHQLAAHNRKESRTLAKLRDALLPKLLSGELRVAIGGGAA